MSREAEDKFWLGFACDFRGPEALARRQLRADSKSRHSLERKREKKKSACALGVGCTKEGFSAQRGTSVQGSRTGKTENHFLVGRAKVEHAHGLVGKSQLRHLHPHSIAHLR